MRRATFEKHFVPYGNYTFQNSIVSILLKGIVRLFPMSFVLPCTARPGRAAGCWLLAAGVLGAGSRGPAQGARERFGRRWRESPTQPSAYL